MRIRVFSGIFSLMLVAGICRAQEAKPPPVVKQKKTKSVLAAGLLSILPGGFYPVPTSGPGRSAHPAVVIPVWFGRF